LLAMLLVVYCSVSTIFCSFWIICGRFTTPCVNVGGGLGVLSLHQHYSYLDFRFFLILCFRAS
jgi:hypothetical protein